MFREMRRKTQLLSPEDTAAVLERGTNGILSVLGEDGYPYGVPLSYIYAEGKIYFHCAKSGHKLDAIRENDKVSFTVVDQDRVVGAELTSYFRSVILFGRARVLEDPEEKLHAHILFSEKYASEYPDRIREEIAGGLDRMEMVEIAVEHLTGKEAIELVRARENG